MFNRRDITAITCYGLLFAAVVLWAELRPANPDLGENFSTARESARVPIGTMPVDLAVDQPEIRRLAKHMRIR
jgi:hypothetical protein